MSLALTVCDFLPTPLELLEIPFWSEGLVGGMFCRADGLGPAEGLGLRPSTPAPALLDPHLLGNAPGSHFPSLFLGQKLGKWGEF